MVLSLSKTNSELSILGKTLTEIKRDAQSGQGVLNSLFSNLAYKDGITSDDVSRIKLFISEWNNGVPAVIAWKNSMQGATVAGKQACVQVAKGSLDIEKLTASAGKAGKAIGTLKNVLINFGATLLATLVVEGLVKLFDYLITTSGEFKEAMDTAFSSFKNAQQNTETIRSELEQINGQIDTLNAKGGLTIIEQDQLDKLREAKRLAEMELSIAEHEERRAAIEAGNKALEYYKSEYGGYSALNDQNVQSAIDGSSDDSLWWLDSKNLPAQVAYFKSMTEEVKAEGNALKEHLGKTYDEIYSEILDRKVKATGQTDPSNIWFLQLEAAKEAKALWTEIEDYETDKTNLSNVENDLRNTYSHLFSIYSDLKTLPEDQLKSLYGDDLEAFNQIANDVDYLFKLFDSAKWSQLKLDEIFDDEKLLKAKDALVELTKAQNGITDVDLSKSGIDLEQWQAALDTINAKYGTNFGLGNIVSQINSEAYTINFDELQRQAEEKVSEEISTIEVDTEIKPKFSLEEFSQWYTKLSPEEQKALSTIQLTPNFKFTDHSLEELYTLIQNQIKASKPEQLDFTSFVQGSDMESLDAELSKIETLKEAMQAVQSGEFDNAALLELTKEFPEAISNTGNMMKFLQGQILDIIGASDDLTTEAYEGKGILEAFDQAIKDAGNNDTAVSQLIALRDVILEIAYEAANMPAINIETEKAGLEALKTAIEEARSATGLTQESVEALQNRYKGLATIEDLFIRTSNGIYLNSRAVNDLEEQYLSLEKQKIDAQLEALIDAYDGTDAAILEQIHDLQILQSQYDGLISKYNQWQNAQSSANARDPFENVGKSIESIENLISDGWATSDDVTSWMELVTGKDYSGEAATKIRDDFYKIKELIGDFYTFDKDGDLTNKGIFNFFDLVEEKMPEFVKTLDDGSKYYDLTGDNILKLAEKLGLSAEFIELIARAAEDAGFKVDWDNKFGVDNIDQALENAEKNLTKLNKDALVLPINFELESGTEEFEQQNKQIEEQINNLKKQLEEDPDNAQAKALLDYYTAAFNKLNPKPIEETLTEKAKSDLQMLYEMDGKTITINAQFGEQYNAVMQVIAALDTIVKTITIDAEAGSGIETVKSDIEGIGTGISAVQINVSLDQTSKTKAKSEIDSIGDNIQDVEIGVGLDSNSKSTVVTDINTIGDNAQPVEITVNVDKTQVTQLNSEVSKQRNANIVALVYDGQVNALDQDIENIPDAEISTNVIRDKFDGLKSEVKNGLNTTITVTLDPEDPLGEIKQYAAQRDSNTNPNGTPKDTGGVVNNPVRSASSSYGLGSQVKFENPLEQVENKEATLEVEVEGQDDVELMINTIDELNDHEFEVKASVQNQEELSQMASTSKEITDVGITATATIAGVEDLRILKQEISTVEGKSVSVGATVSGTDAVNALADAIDRVQGKSVTVEAKTSGGGGDTEATGTAYAYGTAFKEGSWGTKSSGTALMGELGQELLVRNGRFYTVGDNSAEFVNYKKGDIIFNHEQTKQIFEHGRILYGQKRAHALAGGTAFATGNAFGNGSFGASNSGVYESYSSLSSGSASKNKKSSGKKGEKDKEEWFDWIEIAIDRIERAIENLELKATSAFRTWGERTSNLRKQMSLVTDEINLQKRAYDRYIQEANNVGLDAHYARLVREGAIDIELLKDEDLIEKIKDYQEFYEKALDCAYAVDELNESLSELYQQNFEDVTKRFEDMISLIEHEKSLLEESISQSEEQGYIVSVKYYEALIENERKNVEKLYEQRAEMQKALSEAIASGTIAQYSEAWYEMSGDINDVTMSIEEAKTEMIEYNNSIRDIEWEIFDLLQEKIGHVIEETEFLVDLLSNEKLHEDSGQLTGEGLATMGMHGMAYNTYMEQAKRYAKELQEIEKDIANDPNNKDLLERRQELLEAQRDSILAAQDERQEIVDLVEEGIDLELEALEKRIDKYNESLEAAKYLYDYQKKIQESTKEIASLEKQMMAYQGDDSEETKKRVQELKVSLEEARADLEETEYDHYIEDTEKMLDDLYTEYEELLNMRLDDVDTLIKDMIDEINSNSDSINQTLEGLADEFGFELSSILKNSWSSDGNTVTVYDSDIMNSITNAATLLSDELQSIDDGIWEMVNAFDKIANSNISTVPSKTTGYASGAYRISKNQLAWTQEGRNLEAIIRPSDGAILTPLARNDSVLNAHATANLFDFANNPSQFIKENLDLDKVSVNVEPKTFVGNTYDNDFAIQIDLPNVTSYGQFVYELQHDPSFERMIKAMTIDKMFGGSSMNKYRY